MRIAIKTLVRIKPNTQLLHIKKGLAPLFLLYSDRFLSRSSPIAATAVIPRTAIADTKVIATHIVWGVPSVVGVSIADYAVVVVRAVAHHIVH